MIIILLGALSAGTKTYSLCRSDNMLLHLHFGTPHQWVSYKFHVKPKMSVAAVKQK